MLRWRLLLGCLFVGLLAGLFWLDARFVGVFLWPLALVLGLLGAQEMIRLTTLELGSGTAGFRAAPHRGVVYAGTLLVLGGSGLPLVWSGYPADCPLGGFGLPPAALAITLLLCFVAEFLRYENPPAAVVNAALSLLCVAYLGLLAFAVQLRVLPDPQWGLVALAALLATVKMCDVGAYTVGRLCGRHKMAPKLSPGKTWEGFAGGLLFACGGAWLVLTLLPPWIVSEPDAWRPTPPWGILLFGVLVGGAGVLGDLAESLLKRAAGAKDSSAWMPGFGGVLDLLDSILFAAPVAYLCWASGLVGPRAWGP